MSQPRARKGQLKIVFGKIEQDIVICNGEGCPKADANLLWHAFAARILEADFATSYDLELKGLMKPNIFQQLIDRGYDPTTLKVSIEKFSEKGES